MFAKASLFGLLASFLFDAVTIRSRWLRRARRLIAFALVTWTWVSNRRQRQRAAVSPRRETI